MKWNDNRTVIVASNYHRVEPLRKTERYVKSQGKKQIPQPDAIYKYSRGMREAYVCDKKLCSYRPRLRKRFWSWNLFSHDLNRAVVASHEIYRGMNNKKKLIHHDFRVEVAESLLISQQLLR